MTAQRVVDYDLLHLWLTSEMDDAALMASEYDEQGDIEQRDEQIGRSQAFGAVISHVEMFEFEVGS